MSHGAPNPPTPPAAPRWWAPRDARQTGPGGAPRREPGELPASQRAALRLWQRQRAAALQTVIGLIDAAPAGPAATAAALAHSRAQRRRAAARGDAQADAASRPAALASAALAMAPLLGHAVPAALLDAALALGDGGAVELHRAHERQIALALAAAVAAFTGRPLHLLLPSDEQALASADELAPLWAACGLRAGVVTATTPPRDSLLAYHADIVLASARRIAADLARDRRLRAAQAQQLGPGERASLTRGQHGALISELDLVLIDDAMSPLVLSVEEDPTALAAAIAAASGLADKLQPGVDFQTRADGLPVFGPAGQQRLAGLVSALPALWRTPERSLMLLQQALFVRDGLRPGIDYQLGPTGQPLFDDHLAERVPQREWMSGLPQALQARLGLPITALSRTVERSSLQALFAGYHQLAGTAPCLDGLDAELWHGHGLLLLRPPASLTAPAAAAPQCLPTAQARQQALRALISAEATDTAPGSPALLLLRRSTDGPQWASLQQPGQLALALASAGAAPALQALGWRGDARSAPQAGLRLLLPEPLDSLRAETAFERRLADAAATPLRVQRLLHPGARLLRDGLGESATLAERLCAAWPAVAPMLLPPLLALARWRLGRQHAKQRLALLQRDQQLRQQLSFSGPASQTPASAKPGAPPAQDCTRGHPANTAAAAQPAGAAPPATAAQPHLRATGPG